MCFFVFFFKIRELGPKYDTENLFLNDYDVCYKKLYDKTLKNLMIQHQKN